MLKKNKVGIFGIIITIIALILIVIFSNGESNTSFFENVANKLVMPVQNGLTYLKNKVKGNDTFFTDVQNLKQQNSELEQSLRELENIKTENETLKEYLELNQKYAEYKTIPAYIINKDISNYSKTVVINVGAKDGITANMTVIADKGLVGHVVSVTDSTAKVQTIIDTASAISCMMGTNKDSIVCKGTLENTKELRGMYVPTDGNVIQGDSIETSGLGGIYPKGIHVGSVKNVSSSKNITDRYAIIETAVDFDKLDTVLVINN